MTDLECPCCGSHHTEGRRSRYNMKITCRECSQTTYTDPGDPDAEHDRRRGL